MTSSSQMLVSVANLAMLLLNSDYPSNSFFPKSTIATNVAIFKMLLLATLDK